MPDPADMPSKPRSNPLVLHQITRLWPIFTGICGFVLLSLMPALTYSATPPEFTAIALTQAPELDGQITQDQAWVGVNPTEGFTQVRPFEGSKASQRTQVFMGFTNDTLYVAAICHDDNPANIISTDSRRDSALGDTDSFQVIIDSFSDGQNGLIFGTNPAGIEYDGQVARQGDNNGFNLEWNTTWEVATQITAEGWTVEMAIPFRSLRYSGSGKQDWKVNFQRNIRKNNEVVYWSPLSRQFTLSRVSEAGTVRGLVVPNQRNLKVTPYVLASTVRGGELGSQRSNNDEVGVDIKYSLTPSLTLDATYNTDFAQVEADELQVNLNRFSLFFPEKRPFFLENAGQFSVGNPQEVELFFSRRIGIGGGGAALPITGGLRLSGKIGERTNVGLLRMRSDSLAGAAPRNDYTVARVSQEFANRSSLGAIYVERDGDGSFEVAKRDDYNRSYAVDGRLGIGQNINLSGFAAKSDTPGINKDDHAFGVRLNSDSAKWRRDISYSEVGGGFNPEVGFLSRRDYRKVSGFMLRRYRPENLAGLHELRPHVYYQGFWNFDGDHESGFLHVDNHFEWRSGLEIHTGMNFTHEQVLTPFEIVSGVSVPVGTYNHSEVQLVYQTNLSAPLSLDVQVRSGGLFGGDRVSVTPTVAWRVGDRFSSELSWNYNDIDLPVANGDFKINIGRLRLSYSFTPKILLQALVQFNERERTVGTNLRFAWLQNANAGFYLVYNEVDDNSFTGNQRFKPRRELVLKYSRIFDLLH